MSALPYDPAALDANKQGRLTQSQAMSLIPMILMGGIFFLMGAAFAIGSIIGILAILFTTQISSGSVIGSAMIGLTGGGLALVLLAVGYFIGGKRLIDMIRGKVLFMDGTGNRRLGSGGAGNPSLYYKVGETDFQIYGKTYHALPDSTKKVRAYYTPLSKTLINVEMLEDWSFNRAA